MENLNRRKIIKIIMISFLIIILIIAIGLNITFIPKYLEYKRRLNEPTIQMEIQAFDKRTNQSIPLLDNYYETKQPSLGLVMNQYSKLFHLQHFPTGDAWFLGITVHGHDYIGDDSITSPNYWAITSPTNQYCRATSHGLANFCQLGVNKLDITAGDQYLLYFISKN